MKTKLSILAGLILCVFATSKLSAQNGIQTATLVASDGTTQIFYGIDGLKNAVNAASDENTIYLSAGTFNALSGLSKAVKIIGVGGFNENDARNTVIKSMTIQRGDRTYTEYIELEGFKLSGGMTIYNSDNIRIKKIKFGSDFSFTREAVQGDFANIEIIQCLADQYISLYGINTNMLISNSIIRQIQGTVLDFSTIVVSNCIIHYSYYASNLTLQNNIIVANNASGAPNAVNNNIFTGSNNFPSVSNKSGNWENVTLSAIFVNQPENKWDVSYDYNLKNPENYIGTDGTQVGIYGGAYPWNPIPSNPQILESKVEATTTNNGKLNFQIKAEAQQ